YAESMTAPPISRRAAAWPVLTGVAVLAGATAAAIGAMELTAALTATRLPDPGPLTTYGPPFGRAAGAVAAVVAVGSFPVGGFLCAASRQRRVGRRRLSGPAARHLRVRRMVCVRDAAGSPDDFGRVGSSGDRAPRSHDHLVCRRSHQHRGRLAMDRVLCRA